MISVIVDDYNCDRWSGHGVADIMNFKNCIIVYQNIPFSDKKIIVLRRCVSSPDPTHLAP